MVNKETYNIGMIGDKFSNLREKCLIVLELIQTSHNSKLSKKTIQKAIEYMMIRTTELPLLQACTLHKALKNNLLESKAALTHLDACVGRLSKAELEIFENFINGNTIHFLLSLSTQIDNDD